jgi:hypothetical protein
MKRNKSVFRALGIVAATIALVGGVTFAALQSQLGVLHGNSIQTAIASLQVSTNNVSYASSIDGFAFGNIVPGGQATPTNGYPVYIKNAGTSSLALKLSVKGPVTNPDNVDLTKVHIILEPVSAGVPQNFLLSDLIAADTTGGIAVAASSHMNPSVVNSYLMRASMDSDALTGPSGTIGSIDFNFGGTAVN